MSKSYPNAPLSNSVEMNRTLQRGVKALSPDARALVAEFVGSEYDAQGGGFGGRDNASDLYYTIFGLSCAEVLPMCDIIPLNRVMRYLAQQKVACLDFMHQSCWVKNVMLVQRLRSQWGGFSLRQFKLFVMRWMAQRFLTKTKLYEQNTFLQDPYMVYLTINLLQDMGIGLSNSFQRTALSALNFSRSLDGRSYGKVPQQPESGVVSTTVAAILARRQLCGAVDLEALQWVKEQQGSEGGFRASELTTMPDMLSTSVALFALRMCGELSNEQSTRAAQFINDHWLPNGGFASLIDDERSDCEYTFYGLLGLGAITP